MGMTESYSVCGLLLDGKPGLGKTKFTDFAVIEKLAGHVFKVDMTSMLNYKFSQVIDSMYHGVSITTDTIFMIDEIDKYIDYRISVEFDELQKSNTKDSFVQTEEDFRRKQKTTFLYDMLSILERDGLSHSVVVLFCSNNFHSIFDGVDLKHHMIVLLPFNFKNVIMWKL